jgi:hypothetical protein
VCVCSLSYPAHKAHAPYYIAICDLSIFPHYLINSTIFGEALLNIKCVFFLLSLQLLCETFPILRRILRDTIINVQRCLTIAHRHLAGKHEGRDSLGDIGACRLLLLELMLKKEVVGVHWIKQAQDGVQ